MPIVIRTYSFMCAYCTKVHVHEQECIAHERTHSLEERRKIDGPDLPSTAPIAQVHLKQRDQLQKLLTDAATCLEEDIVMLKGMSTIKAGGSTVTTCNQSTSTNTSTIGVPTTTHVVHRLQERPQLTATHMNGQAIVPPVRSKPFRYPTVPTEFRGLVRHAPIYRPIRPRILATSIGMGGTIYARPPTAVPIRTVRPPARPEVMDEMVIASSSAIEMAESSDDEDHDDLDDMEESSGENGNEIVSDLFRTPAVSSIGMSVKRPVVQSEPMKRGSGPIIDSALGRMKTKYSKMRAQKVFGAGKQRQYTLQCDVCKQMFNKRWNLHRHELQQHDIRSPGNFQNLYTKKEENDRVKKEIE